jgi:hypothetical protein
MSGDDSHDLERWTHLLLQRKRSTGKTGEICPINSAESPFLSVVDSYLRGINDGVIFERGLLNA